MFLQALNLWVVQEESWRFSMVAPSKVEWDPGCGRLFYRVVSVYWDFAPSDL